MSKDLDTFVTKNLFYIVPSKQIKSFFNKRRYFTTISKHKIDSDFFKNH